jgi:hypothetical protein
MVWQVMERLKRGEALPGIVRDDAAVFAAAVKRGLAIQSFDVLLPDARFQDFQAVLAAEHRQRSTEPRAVADGANPGPPV